MDPNHCPNIRFLYLGPAIATMAGWAWVEDGWEITAEALVVCAFLAHALHHGMRCKDIQQGKCRM